jgi:hypothetical protein
MLVFLIDNIFAMFGGRVFQQTIGIWVPTVLVFSLTCSFIRMRQISYKGFSRKTKRGYPSRSFNFTFRHVDDILSLNNSRFGDFVDHIYPIEFEIKDTTDTYSSASYLDLHLEIGSEGRLRTKLYDKRDDFNFPIVNFPFICSNIPAAPTYGVYISQMIRYSRACSYQDFLDRELLLTRKLLNQRFLLIRLKSSLRNFSVATMTWLTVMEYLCHK